MKTLTKTGIVIAGYGCALAIGIAVAYARYKSMENLPDAQAASGMYAFGDFMTFLFVFGVASLVPSGLAFYFLRENRTFWTVMAVCAAVVAAGNVALAAAYWMQWRMPDLTMLHPWSSLAPLRMIIAPLVAATIFLCAQFAPDPRPRRAMRIAGAVEILASMPYLSFLVWAVVTR